MTIQARTGIVLDERYQEHQTGPSHPERPDRLRALSATIDEQGLLPTLQRIEPMPAELERVESVHSPAYIERVRQACEAGAKFIDAPDSAICPASYDIARLAAGGLLAAVDGVMRGELANAFCAVRPPGHHAERALSMGFCLFNNVAIAARHLQQQWGLNRVLILDWDVHHGNGTQHTFEDDPSVFFCSMHQHPAYLYPGTGYPTERGTGPGEGTTLNLTMMPGAGDADYRKAFEESFAPAAEAFKPEFILVSAGFDAHRRDPLAQIELSDDAFAWLSTETLALANRACNGRLVSTLEGGYDLEALATCATAHVRILADTTKERGTQRTQNRVGR